MTIKEWIRENLDSDEITNIVDHGCISGACSPLIYYTDTIEFYDNHRVEIWELLEQESINHGYKNVIEFLGSWGDYGKHIFTDVTFKNALAWWSVEQVCYELTLSEMVA